MRRHTSLLPRLRSVLEQLEARIFLSTSTPFTADGHRWEILPASPSWVEAENFDYGGANVAYTSNNSNNPGGAYRPNEKVGIQGPNSYTGNTYNTGYFNTGNWMKYSVHVDTAGTYVLNLHASTATTSSAGHITLDNGLGTVVNSGTLTIPNTGGWGNFKDFTAAVSLLAGDQTMTVFDDSGQFNIDYIGVTPQAVASSAEQAYSPETNTSTTLFRNVPTLLTAFGGAQVESENFDFGGAAGGSTGVQSAGYYWANPSGAYATYPYTANAFRPTDTVNTADSGSGIVTTNWLGGNWAQYSVVAPTNLTPLDPTSAASSYQAATLNLQYQLLLTYSNSGATNSTFTISDTAGSPAALSQLGTIVLPPTSGNYQSVAVQLTLPSNGLNVLRFIDADTTGVNSHVNIDYFRMLNSTTSGNAGLPWDVAASGATTHIQADNFDSAPGSVIYPAGTSPVIAATTDTNGNGNEIQGFTANDVLTYTISTHLSGQYSIGLRVNNTGTSAAQMQVTFDSGAAFGGPTDPVVFNFTVPTGSSYQTITTSTDVSQLPQTTNAYVAIQTGPQKMQIKMLSGTVKFHWVELSKITTVSLDKPDSAQSGTYAAQPPDAAMNSVGDLFDRVYNTSYYWINPPANASVPTNDWWTNLLVSQFAGTMYVFPQSLGDAANGVTFSTYSGWGTNSAGTSIQNTGQQSVLIGAANTSFTQDALLDYGDWTVHYRMSTSTNASMDVTMGRGMPYTWFEYNSLTPTITLQPSFNIYNSSGVAQTGTIVGSNFRIDTGGEQIGVFAPAGTTFSRTNAIFTVTFAANVAPYLVTAVLPDSSNATLALFAQHAYVIPRQVGSTQSSTYTWSYNTAAGKVATNWNLNLVPIDPNNAPPSTTTIQGWLPIEYSNGATPPALATNGSGQAYQYPSLNGYIKFSIGSSFVVSQTTVGVNFELALPQTIGAPTVAYDPNNPGTTMVSTDYSPEQMLTYIQKYIQQNTNTAASQAAGTTILNYGTDTYWGGKPLQEYAEFALMAKQLGDTNDYNILLTNLASIMTNWFTYTPGETSNYFAYYPSAHSLIGFNPSYGSEDFTDNMFHYGYFTAAAGVLCMLDPAWAAQYGSMAKMVAMQYANWLHSGDIPDLTDPNATSLPFLRTFEPWIGHSYAGGTSSGGGNNEESSSEAIQSWLGIILLGQALNDPAMTAAGMMGYTIESKAVQQQWFNQAPGVTDPNGLGFPAGYRDANGATNYSNVAINFDDGKSYATYFGANPEYVLGIEALPIWPSLDFLGRNSAAATAATQSMLTERTIYFSNSADNTFASFETGGENDWLNIALGYQAQYDPQSTALQYARMIAQQTPTGVTGSTGLYYFQDHSSQTFGLRNWNEHLSLPLGGVYSHGNDSTSMANTQTYECYNPGAAATTVYVYDGSGTVLDSFTAQPGYNVVTRSSNATNAPPIITTGAGVSPNPATGTTAQLSVLANDQTQTPSVITYTWSMASGPNGASLSFSPNGTNGAKNTTVTFNMAGSYTVNVVATDSNGLSVTTSLVVTVNPTLTNLAISPNPLSIFVNTNQQFTASGTDQFGNAVSNPTVVWSVQSGGDGTINNTGLFRSGASSGSAVVQAVSGSITTTANVTVVVQLAAPTNLAGTNIGSSEVDLSWTAPSGTITGYYIYRGLTPGAESSTALNSTPVATTTYKDKQVLPYTTYFYTVKAVNSGGASTASNEASATTSTDLALSHPATASSIEAAANAASYAVDGNDTTRWSTQFSDPQWIDVDLGSVKPIAEIKLNWEAAAGKNYLLQVSTDTAQPASTSPDWTTVATVTNNTTAGWKDYAGLSASGRWVQMYGTVRVGPYGYSLYDLSVYGPKPVAAVSLTGSNYLQMDPTVFGQLDTWTGTSSTGNPAGKYFVNEVSTITDTASSTTDQLTVDFTDGNPLGVLTPGATFTGLDAGINRVNLIGDSAGDTYTVSAGGVQISGGTGSGAFTAVPLNFTKVSSLVINGGSGNDTYHQTSTNAAAVTFNGSGGLDNIMLDANVGALSLVAPAGSGTPTIKLQSLSLATGDTVNFSSAPGHSGKSLLQVSSLSFTGSSNAWLGQLDLQGNDMVIHNGNLTNLTNQIKHGYNSGAWGGTGIASSAAANDISALTTLGLVQNNSGGSAVLYSSFDSQSVVASDVLVKYTYYGDANLDGTVNSSDYSQIDNGFNTAGTGWYNGDFNYDGAVNSSDYSLIDNAFNQGGSTLSIDPAPASPAALIAVPTAQVASLPEPANTLIADSPRSAIAINLWPGADMNQDDTLHHSNRTIGRRFASTTLIGIARL